MSSLGQSDMAPRTTMQDRSNSALRDSILSGHFSLGHTSRGTNSKHLLFRQDGTVVLRTQSLGRKYQPPFQDLIPIIVPVSSQKQMPPTIELNAVQYVDTVFIVAGTRRVITDVEHIKSRRNGHSACHFPSNPMGHQRTSVLATTTNVDFPVAIRLMSTGPHPAWPELRDKQWPVLIDVSHEPLSKRASPGLRPSYVGTRPTAIADVEMGDFPSWPCEESATLQTRAINEIGCRLGVHAEPHFPCAIPPAVAPVRGSSRTHILPRIDYQQPLVAAS